MIEKRMNDGRFNFGVGNQYTTDFSKLTYHDTVVSAIEASDFNKDEHVFVLYKATGEVVDEFDSGFLDEMTLRFFGATDSEISKVLKDNASELLNSAADKPQEFARCIDSYMIDNVHHQPGNNKRLASADFSDGFNSFYKFINDDYLIRNILKSKFSGKALESLFKRVELTTPRDYEELAAELIGAERTEEMVSSVQNSYVETSDYFGITYNQTTSAYELDAGDVEKYHITQLKDFEEEMNLKSGTLVDHYDFEIGSFDEVLSLDEDNLPHITEESSLDDADYVTHNENGKLVFFSAHQINFAGNSEVLSSIEVFEKFNSFDDYTDNEVSDWFHQKEENQEFLRQSTNKFYSMILSDGSKHDFTIDSKIPDTIDDVLTEPYTGIEIKPSDNSEIPFVIEDTGTLAQPPVGLIAHDLKTNRVEIEAINPSIPSADAILLDARNTKIAELVSGVTNNKSKGQTR